MGLLATIAIDANPDEDLYAILGVERSATQREIKRKYRALARELHPDKYEAEDPEAAQEQFQRVQDAYAILGDEEKRVAYDESGGAEQFTFDSRWEWEENARRQGKRLESKGFFQDFELIKKHSPSSLWNDYRDNKQVFVCKFYAPWCSHCLESAPSLRSLAIQLDAEESPVKITAVNCEQHYRLCENFNVDSYPTLVLFYTEDGERESSVYEERGHDVDAMREWITRTTENKVIALSRISPVMNSNALWIVAFSAGRWCGPCTELKATLRRTAYELHGIASVGTVNCDRYQHVCDELEVPHYPFLTIFPRGQEQKRAEGYRVLRLSHGNFPAASILDLLSEVLPAALTWQPTSSVDRTVVEEEVRDIYERYAPQKLKGIDDLMKKWHGRFDDLLAKLRQKYVNTNEL